MIGRTSTVTMFQRKAELSDSKIRHHVQLTTCHNASSDRTSSRSVRVQISDRLPFELRSRSRRRCLQGLHDSFRVAGHWSENVRVLNITCRWTLCRSQCSGNWERNATVLATSSSAQLPRPPALSVSRNTDALPWSTHAKTDCNTPCSFYRVTEHNRFIGK